MEEKDYTIYINKTYNNLTIKEIINKPENCNIYNGASKEWCRCECNCGKKDVKFPLNMVTKGQVKSCGHRRIEVATASLNKNRNSLHAEIKLTYMGKTMNITQWAKTLGMARTTILYRYNKGLPVEEIFRSTKKETDTWRIE